VQEEADRDADEPVGILVGRRLAHPTLEEALADLIRCRVASYDTR
jgi:hypothetical protein